jgi:uncharacterized membrane protein YdjX (TVP38/TMEM64 family)
MRKSKEPGDQVGAGPPTRTRRFFAAGALLLIAAATVAVLGGHWLQAAIAWTAARRTSAWAPFVVLYALAAVVLLPEFLLTIAAGAIFGLAWGLLLVSIGSMIGAAAAFLLGRTLAREWVRRKIEQWPKFRALDQAIQRQGFWIVFLTRLTPLIPYGLLNYVYGITGVSFIQYLPASWIGMLPGTLLYVYAGTAAANLGQVLGGRVSAGPKGTTLLWVGLGATIAVVAILTYLARRELERELRS